MLAQYIKKYEKWSLIVSILMLVLAIFLIVKPLESVSTIIIIFGIIVMIDGILHLVDYFRTDSQTRMMSFSLMEGIIGILAGVLVIITADTLTAFLPILLAIWIIIKSIASFQIAINLKTIPQSGWGWMLMFSIITLILGLIIIFNPFETAAIATSTIGIILAISQGIDIVETIITLIKIKE